MNRVLRGHPVIASGALEFLKWFAVLLMFGDHVNAAFFGRQLPVLSEVARIVFPIFAMILGYNLARPAASKGRALRRLLLVASIAQPFHAIAFGQLLPLNVLFTFAAAVASLLLWEKNQVLFAAAVLVLSGLFVDYSWPGVALVIGAYWFTRSPAVFPAAIALASLLGLQWINGTQYALWAVPVLLLARLGDWRIPRSPRAFYVIYPAHLAVIAAILVMGSVFR